MLEEWIDALGYDGIYEVSNLGRVKSLGRWVSNGKSERWVKERILSPCRDKKGRLNVFLYIGNVSSSFAVSTLVYYSFNRDKSPEDSTYCIMHKDKVVDNNRLDNLELVKVSFSHSVNHEKGLLPHLAENNRIAVEKRNQLTHKTCRICTNSKDIKHFEKGRNICNTCRKDQKHDYYLKTLKNKTTNN